MIQDQTYQFYFGPATSAEPDGEYFTDESGNLFYFKIVMEEDMFFIFDTCGRSIPVDREFINGMNTALFAVTQLYQAADDADALFQRKHREVMHLVEYWNKEDASE